MAPQGKTKAGTGTQTNADTGTVEALLDMLSGDEDKEDEDEEFQVAPVKAEEAEESKGASDIYNRCNQYTTEQDKKVTRHVLRNEESGKLMAAMKKAPKEVR